MTSIDTPGDGANIGGKPITGVSGPSGCDKSMTVIRPAARSATSDASVDMFLLSSLQVALKLETVFEQAEVGDECGRTRRLDLRDKRRQVVGLLRGRELEDE